MMDAKLEQRRLCSVIPVIVLLMPVIIYVYAIHLLHAIQHNERRIYLIIAYINK